jgi:foldase protein PrsA
MVERLMCALAIAALAFNQSASGQQGGVGGSPGGSVGGTSPNRASRPQAGQPSAVDPASQGVLKAVAVPVNPDDAVALVNRESISRRELADECVARKGKEILETLIARKLIEQALRAKHLDVTAAEINAEIDNVARTMAGVGREAWLRSLDKERGISPVQYARDIIYPSIALRKLAAPLVTVTEQDMNDAFEAQFGDKLRCRIIMCDKLQQAKEIWERLKNNPAGFEKEAQDHSIDMTSRSLGGLLGEPITRHAYPRTVSDAAFLQLVDGDPNDKDPSHKPKNGDMTGAIQVTESTWAILRRESVIPGQKADRNDPATRKMIHSMMYDAKVKAKMGEVLQDLMRAAAIENRLTGETKMANESEETQKLQDGQVQLMSNPDGKIPPSPAATRGAQSSPGSGAAGQKPNGAAPVGVTPDQAKRAEALKRALKQRTGVPAPGQAGAPATSPAPAAAPASSPGQDSAPM